MSPLSRYRILLAMLTLLSSAPATLGQAADEASPAAALKRAIHLEEAEQDLPVAITLYRSIIGNASATSEQQTAAWLRLAGCLRALGRDDEAQQALVRAAAGSGPSAMRARAVLDGSAASDDRVRSRVETLMRQSLQPGSKAYQQIVMIGPAAVPVLIDAIDQGVYEFYELGSVLAPILQIGGPDAERFVRRLAQSDDQLLKRLLIESCGVIQPDSTVVEAFYDLLRDGDAVVRREALQQVRYVVPEEILGGMLEDSAADVRAQAIKIIGDRDLTGNSTFMASIAQQIARAWEDADAHLRSVALAVPQDTQILDTAAGRRLFLLALPLEAIPADSRPSRWPLTLFNKSVTKHVAGQPVRSMETIRTPFDTKVAADAVLTAARTLASQRVAGGVTRRSALAYFVTRCLPTWNHDALPVVFELWDLGYGRASGLDAWIAEHARNADATQVARCLDAPWSSPAIVDWLGQRELSADAFEPLREGMERELGRHGSARVQGSRLEKLFRLVAANPSDQVTPYLLDLARRHTSTLGMYVTLTLMERQDSAASRAMSDLIRLPVSGRERVKILKHLAESGDDRLADLAAVAYRLGFPGSSSRDGFLRWLFASDSTHALDDRVAVDVLDRCLAVEGESSVWLEVEDIFLGRWPEHVSRRVADVLCRRADDLEGLSEQFRNGVYSGVLMHSYNATTESLALANRLLASGDPAVELIGAKWILTRDTDPSSRESAIQTLRRQLADASADIRRAAISPLSTCGDARAFEWIRSLLMDPSVTVRVEAAKKLYQQNPVEPIEPLFELLRESNAYVRASAAAILGLTLDRAAFPALIEALRDPDEAVRTAADDSLDAIQKYHDRVDRWRKWLREADLEADSAAEALLLQTSADNPEDVRVAAIQSLGTLAVPETLPLLIRLMTDADQRVAEAAREAVRRINGKSIDE